MRIYVVGDGEAAKNLRSTLSSTFEFAPTAADADYTVHLKVDSGLKSVIMDSVDCPLERYIAQHLRELVDARVELQTKGGIQSDREAGIILPADPKLQVQAVQAIHRGFLDLMNKGDGRIQVRQPAATDNPSQLLPAVQLMLSESLNQVALIMTGAADRAAQNQARLEIQALGAKLQADQQVFNNLVNTSLDEQIRAIIDTQRQERDYMDARFRTLQAELLTTLIRQFSPRPIANPSLWQRVVALFTGRIQVLDRPYPSVNVGGDK